jgi:hypothetical protein
MLPLPTSRVFRSRRAALRWSAWVVVAAVASVGVAGSTSGKRTVAERATDSLGMQVDDQELKKLLAAMKTG